jgi:predicted oxidoreductase
VSNFNAMQIELLQRHLHQPLVVQQFQLGLQHYSSIGETSSRAFGFGGMVDYCRLHDIQVEAFSPLMGEVDPRLNILRPLANASLEVKRAA